jgi:hypothetical protein
VEDVHSATGVLKLWVRELPDPLIPHRYFILNVLHIHSPNLNIASSYDLFIAAAVEKDIDRDGLAEIIKLLPAPNYELLKDLILHLRKVIHTAYITSLSNFPVFGIILWVGGFIQRCQYDD